MKPIPIHRPWCARSDLGRHRRRRPRRGLCRSHCRRPHEASRHLQYSDHRFGRGLRRRLVLEPLPRHPVRYRFLLLPADAGRSRLHAEGQKYSLGEEVFEHCRRIGRHFGLYEKALFGTLIRSIALGRSIKRWRIGTNRDDDIRASFVVMCPGPLNRPKLPGHPRNPELQGSHLPHGALGL